MCVCVWGGDMSKRDYEREGIYNKENNDIDIYIYVYIKKKVLTDSRQYNL